MPIRVIETRPIKCLVFGIVAGFIVETTDAIEGRDPRLHHEPSLYEAISQVSIETQITGSYAISGMTFSTKNGQEWFTGSIRAI
jgi:hypothetical protein